MQRQTLDFGAGKVELSVVDNIIYLKIFGVYTDEMALEMTRRLDGIIKTVPGTPIRIWDGSQLRAEDFRLSTQVLEQISSWAERIKERKPGSKAYFIAREPFIFGTSRMYELQVGDEQLEVEVLHHFNELPKEIREKITP